MGKSMKAGAILAICALVGLSACGDDDDVSSSGDASEITSDSTDTTSAGSADTTAATDAPDDTAGSSGGEFDGDFCAKTAQMMDEFDDLDLDTEDFGAMSDRFNEMLDAIDELADEAPDELKDDFETLSGAFSEIKDILPRLSEMMAAVQEAGTDQQKLAEVMEEYGDLMETDMSSLNSAEVEQAGQNISDYVQDVCGLDVGS